MIDKLTNMRFGRWLAAPCVAAIASLTFAPEMNAVVAEDGGSKPGYFRRIATFPIFENSDVDEETVAEIVTASKDGNYLIYTDSQLERIGFVNIFAAGRPLPAGTVQLDGEPTSVGVVRQYALAGVNTSESFTNPSGQLDIINYKLRKSIRKIELGGQPDAIAVSPNGRYAAIAIENERDEDFNDGDIPQLPAGCLIIVDTVGDPGDWTIRKVDLTGLALVAPEDPEPEFVDINENNVAVVTMQENNHIVLVDLRSGAVIDHFPAGTADLDQIDTEENDLIQLNSSLAGIPREPDAVAWISGYEFATADEGDYLGGSRGFSIFDREGNLKFTSGSEDDHIMTMIGHYPESRSENKGNEPEGAEVGTFRGDRLLFIGSERSSVISVYKVEKQNNYSPEFIQVLPAGIGPEGILAIPSRSLLVVSSEEDSRGDGFRSSITIYRRDAYMPDYPTIASMDSGDGTPIPWAALSALAPSTKYPDVAYTTYDSYYKASRIFKVDASGVPALITKQIVLSDDGGVFFDALVGAGYDAGAIADLINEDLTVNLDPEGLATRQDGGFWLASEGAGTIGDSDNPFEFDNFLIKVAYSGEIEEVVLLPEATRALQVRFGFEGVSSVGSGDDERVYVCIQRAWTGDPSSKARLGMYVPSTGEWSFAYYPLDARESPNGGWVGLSEIAHVDGDYFYILERDNQAGTDARIKRIYKVDLGSVAFLPEGSAFETLEKWLARDVLPDLAAPNGAVIEKVEGLAKMLDGDVLIVTDNDGVDDSSGETQFINLGSIE